MKFTQKKCNIMLPKTKSANALKHNVLVSITSPYILTRNSGLVMVELTSHAKSP